MNSAAVEYDGKNKYIRITDIEENSHQYIDSEPVSPDGNLEEKYIVKNNDILFARTGASVGKTYLYNSKDGLLYFAGFLIRVNIEEPNNSYFVFNQTLTERYKKWVLNTSMRSGQPGINSQEYGEYKIYYPSVSEQNKIAEFLSLVDKRIEKQRQLIENLKKDKRGLFEQIFKEYGNINVKLKDLLIEKNEKSKTNNEYEIISSTKQGLFLQSEYFNKQAASENTVGYKILRKNQVVFSPQNLWMGNINFNSDFEIGIVSPSYKIYDINPDYNAYFVGLILKSSKALKEYVLASEQGASIVRRNLNIEMFNEITLKFPDRILQNKLANYMKAVEKHLNNQEKNLNNILKLKQGLLQQMFI